MKIPSVTNDESKISTYVEQRLSDIGMHVIRFQNNVLGTCGSGSPSLLLCGHLDTVPPYFAPQIVGGKLFGRGSADDKGGVASVIHALSQITTCDFAGTLFALFVVDEEVNSSGIDAMIPNVQADYGVVCEPTNLHVVNGHKGRMVLQVRTIGKTAHASKPENGQNAILEMAKNLAKLDQFKLNTHPSLGRETLTVSCISGGVANNVVPDCCTIKLDYRHVPPNNPTNVLKSLIEFLPDAQISFTKDPTYFSSPFYLPKHIIIDELCSVLRALGIKPTLTTMEACTDASRLNSAGIPTIVFGPGRLKQAHTSNEWVVLKQVKTASAIFQKLIERVLIN